MNRYAPIARHARIEVEDILARVILEPSGLHQLEVVVPSEVVGMKFTGEQVGQLEAACAKYRALVASADGGPDFHNRKTVSLEVGR